jgi:hypothetical protein
LATAKSKQGMMREYPLESARSGLCARRFSLRRRPSCRGKGVETDAAERRIRRIDAAFSKDIDNLVCY